MYTQYLYIYTNNDTRRNLVNCILHGMLVIATRSAYNIQPKKKFTRNRTKRHNLKKKVGRVSQLD